MAWIARMSKNVNVMHYVLMQIIKRSSTLRASDKGDKPPPRTLYFEGSQDGQIKQFLETSQLIQDFLKENDKPEVLKTVGRASP